MDAYDRCTNLEKKILPILLPSMVAAENFSGHPRTCHADDLELMGGTQIPYTLKTRLI